MAERTVKDYLEMAELAAGSDADSYPSFARKASTLKERVQPCEACGYPISHKHHLLSVAEFGENNTAVRLCPNCHELYHIVARIEAAWARGTRNAKAEILRNRLGEVFWDDARINAVYFVHGLVDRAGRLRAWAIEHPDLVSKITRRQQRRQP